MEIVLMELQTIDIISIVLECLDVHCENCTNDLSQHDSDWNWILRNFQSSILMIFFKFCSKQLLYDIVSRM